jgi:hypothetical protein
MSSREDAQQSLEGWLLDNRWPDAYELSHAISDWLAAHDEAIRAEVREAPVVHVTEIRLRLDDPWDVCDVGVYPIVGSLEATLADVANRLEAELDRTKETDRTKHVSRTLGDGLLRKVQVETIHRGGESFFRHTITQSSNQWLDGPRGADTTEGAL